jgi:hypothetical protein
VWVHDPDNSKLDGRSNIGRWVGFDEVSSGHRVYFEGKHRIAVERSVKFDSDDMTIPIPVELQFEGEQDEGNQHSTTNQTPNTHRNPIPPVQSTSKIPTTPPRTPQKPSTLLPQSPSAAKLRQQFARTDPLGSDFEHPTIEETPIGRGQRTRKPSAYIRDLQSGAGTTSNRPSDPRVPRGMQMPEGTPSTVEEELAASAELNDDWEMVAVLEHGLVAATSNAEALDPSTLTEAKERIDWPHWDAAIRTELDALKSAGTWEIVPRPNPDRNVVD